MTPGPANKTAGGRPRDGRKAPEGNGYLKGGWRTATRRMEVAHNTVRGCPTIMSATRREGGRPDDATTCPQDSQGTLTACKDIQEAATTFLKNGSPMPSHADEANARSSAACQGWLLVALSMKKFFLFFNYTAHSPGHLAAILSGKQLYGHPGTERSWAS